MVSKIKRNQCWFQTAIFILLTSLTFLSSASGYQDSNSGYHDNAILQNANSDQALLQSILSLDHRLNNLRLSIETRFTSLEQRLNNLEQLASKTSSSATNRNGVTKIITEPKIDMGRSKITKFENGSMLVTCVAEGNPAPDVSFRDINSLEPVDYVITYTDLNETTRQADLFIEDREAVERFWRVKCEAQVYNQVTDTVEWLVA